MIKVPARRKFSRNTMIPTSTPSNSDFIRNNQKNRSSIIQKIHSESECQEIQQPSEVYDSYANSKRTLGNQSLKPQTKNQLDSTHQLSRTSSLKPSSRFISSECNEVTSRKFNRLDNLNSSLIKIEENDNKDSAKTIRMSEPAHFIGTRSPALKQTKNAEPILSKRRTTRKASIFLKSHNMVLNHESEHYGEFLQESNLNHLANFVRNLACEPVSENDEQKENDLSSKNSKSQIEQKKVQIIGSEKSTKQMKKGRRPKNILRKVSSNIKKSSQKQLKTLNDEDRSLKTMYQCMTQAKLKVEDDENEMSEKEKTLKMEVSPRTYNESEKTRRKEEELRNAEELRIEKENMLKDQTEELFRLLEREIASKQEMERFKKKSNNYYEQLRQRLLQKYERIWKDYRMDEKDRDNIGLLIDGCNLERHRRVNNYYFEQKQSAAGGRMDAAAIGQATKDINKLNFANKGRNKTIMRPKTSRPKSLSKSRYNKYSNEKSSNNLMSDYIGNTQSNLVSNLNLTYNRLSQPDTEFMFITNPDIKSRTNLKNPATQRPKTAYSKDRHSNSTQHSANQREMIKDKVELANRFSALLSVCDWENDQQVETKKKMKVFEYFCNKIDNGFEKLSNRITEYMGNL